MRLCLRTDLYVGCPVYFWPWVFWQLLQLDLWVEQTGRSVLGAVCKRTGEVFITFTADDPEEVRPWRDSDLQALLPKALARALSTSDCPGLPISAHSRAGGDLVPFCSGLAEPDTRSHPELVEGRGNERALWNSVFGLPPPVP